MKRVITATFRDGEVMRVERNGSDIWYAWRVILTDTHDGETRVGRGWSLNAKTANKRSTETAIAMRKEFGGVAVREWLAIDGSEG